MAVPIWKDKTISLGSSDSYYYRIRLTDSTGAIIYSGKAFKKPSASNVEVRINDICADYLEQALPSLYNAVFAIQDFEQVFYVEKSTDGTTYTSAESVTFYLDWSYDYDFVVADSGLSHPIVREVAKNQYLFYTTLLANSVSVTYYFTDGTSMTQTIEIARGADYNEDYDDDFTITASGPHWGNAVVNLSNVSNLSKVKFGNRTYNVLDSCYDYALYYVNAYGGWDTFTIKGLTKKTDNYTRHTQKEEYVNTDIKNRGIRNYVNEVSRAYEIKTGWLSDDSASRMHHLLGSTNVYLYDFVESQMIPVTIEDTACEYKTYHNQGNKLVNYTINVVEAHEMVRK